ncbi:MAG: TetR/AcrR family transcriptional regulator C-terminal ligand-binding domain-containing protein [Solirubrobacteraceae bacterium]|nr:TetR/AcrR family transcriptional regulator C-terminal ligand-binding domain-containing protein [Patulibacter sp.]
MSTATSKPGRVTTGARTGGRSERVRAAIFEATIAELLESGYGGLTLSSVAKKADVALSTVNRRWATKPKLVADVLVDMTAMAVPDPDTGALETDLRQIAQSLATGFSNPQVRVLIRSMLALPEDEQVAIRTKHWDLRQENADRIIGRAVDRGEIPPQRDAFRVLELLGATVWMRALVTGGPLDQAVLDQLVDDVLVVARRGTPDPA